MKNLILVFLTIFLFSFKGGNIDKEDIKFELQKQGILFPDVTLRIMYVETQLGKTAKYNNLFGFKTKKGYLRFNSWKDCIIYYKSWQERKFLPHLEKYHKKSECDYYCFLRSVGYVSGKKNSDREYQYTKKLKSVKI